jgi:hypothetical protein
MKKYYDEFVRLSIDKMAQAIENMTYLYKETKVPKKHYKEQLDVQIEQIIAESVAINLLAPYIQTIKSLVEQSPKSFFQALICIDRKINLTNIKPNEYQALEIAYHEFTNGKKCNYSDKDILAIYDEIIKNGTSNYYSNKMTDINGDSELN